MVVQEMILKVNAVLGGRTRQVAGGGVAWLGAVLVLGSKAAAPGGARGRPYRGGTAALRHGRGAAGRLGTGTHCAL